jgi:hypothetical protein
MAEASVLLRPPSRAKNVLQLHILVVGDRLGSPMLHVLGEHVQRKAYADNVLALGGRRATLSELHCSKSINSGFHEGFSEYKMAAVAPNIRTI